MVRKDGGRKLSHMSRGHRQTERMDTKKEMEPKKKNGISERVDTEVREREDCPVLGHTYYTTRGAAATILSIGESTYRWSCGDERKAGWRCQYGMEGNNKNREKNRKKKKKENLG